MSGNRVLQSADDVTAAWLGQVLRQSVERVRCSAGHGNWSHQIAIEAEMRDGGRRRLTIPPDKGYGARGAGGVIKPNETLVFVVDLMAVR